ncbi:MAG: hypothetical protein Q9210_007062, partial [Variospora velana]
TMFRKGFIPNKTAEKIADPKPDFTWGLIVPRKQEAGQRLIVVKSEVENWIKICPGLQHAFLTSQLKGASKPIEEAENQAIPTGAVLVSVRRRINAKAAAAKALPAGGPTNQPCPINNAANNQFTSICSRADFELIAFTITWYPNEPMQDHNELRQGLSINQWRKEVAHASQPHTLSSPQGDGTSPRRLRSGRRTARSGLHEISGNRQEPKPSTEAQNITSEPTRKRKRNMPPGRPGRPRGRGQGAHNGGVNQDGNENEYLPPRGRGRPSTRPSQQPRRGTGSRVPLNDTNDRPPSSAPTVRSSSRSRSRKRATFDQSPSLTTVSLSDLASCDPPVKKKTREQVKLEFPDICGPTMDLFAQLKHDSYEKDSDTPRKSRDAPHTDEFSSRGDTLFPRERLTTIKEQVDEALKDAEWNDRHNAQEGQWGTVVHLLLKEVARWPRPQKLRVLNTERCAVGPLDLYTKTPGHVPLVYGTESRTTDNEAETTPGSEISKMIDWSLVLNLDSKDEEKIDAAFSKLNVHERSLNQSLSYIKRSPLVVDLEIKKQQPGNSPEVQIAIWASAALKKRRWHGWDTSLPMPAITVEGHRWDWYLLMAAGKGLLMLGPFAMGSTSDLTGVWQILYRLKILADWGATTYKRWFDDHVITWAEASIPVAGKENSSALEKEAEAMTLGNEMG